MVRRRAFARHLRRPVARLLTTPGMQSMLPGRGTGCLVREGEGPAVPDPVLLLHVSKRLRRVARAYGPAYGTVVSSERCACSVEHGA